MSTATTSTDSTGNNNYGSNPAVNANMQRSTSARSNNAQMGYVALMRRQKATVWCDRSQPEDPRVRAQKMADKKRAYLEVHGARSGKAPTLGSGKIKHGGKTVADFSPSTLVGAAVPVRLSANEVGDADDAHSDAGKYHRRTGSGRSSQGSSLRYSQRPPTGQMGSNEASPNEKSEREDLETPLARDSKHGSANEDAATTHTQGSEQEDYFGIVGEMNAPNAAVAAAEKARKADELRRRGSVDDRTTSMTGTRLFIANPDLSD